MYSVVLLIGSTKFKKIFLDVEEKLSLKGYLVFTPSIYNQSGEAPGCGVETKKILDTAAKMKVCRSDIVIVIDKDGYVGSSTKNQIEWAKLLNKPVLYYSQGDVDRL